MTEEGKEPATISAGEVWSKVKAQPLYEKLFTWGAVVYLGSSIMPGSAYHAYIAVVVAAGLAFHLAALVGFGPGAADAYWRIYFWACLVAAVMGAIMLLVNVPSIGSWELGFVIGMMGLTTYVFATYKVCEARRLLPFKLTK